MEKTLVKRKKNRFSNCSVIYHYEVLKVIAKCTSFIKRTR